MKKYLIFTLLIANLFAFNSCEKPEGEFGTSTIYGKVFVKDYNSTFTRLIDSYYGADIWVMIIYGNNRTYNDRVKTSYDGTYEFKFLSQGNYRIYAYSKDSTLETTNPIGIVKEVEITKNKQVIEVPDIVIFD